MLMRRVSTKEKVNNGLVRAALVAGVASAVAVGSLSGVGPANGTCIGFSGFNINLGGGGGCNSSFGNFALGLGTGTVADASGGFLNGAIAVGTNVAAFAEGSGFSVANLALNLGTAKDPIDPVTGVPTGTGYNRVTAGPGFLNLAGNFGGSSGDSGEAGRPADPMDIRAEGVASSALNFIGNRNKLTSTGILANSTVVGNVFGFPNGSDNEVTSTGPLSVAFVRQGIFSQPCNVSRCGNTVTANGFSIAGVINAVGRSPVSGPGHRINIDIGSPFDAPGTGTTASTFAAPTTFASGSPNGSGGGGSLTKGGNQLSSSLKKLSDGVKNALGGLGKKKQTSTPD